LREQYCIWSGANKENIIKTSDYEAAIAALKKNKFDVIILDMGFYMQGVATEDEWDWAGLSVLEYMVSNKIITPILIDSNTVQRDLDMLYQKIKKYSARYPNLARLGTDTLNRFLGLFPMRVSARPNNDHFRALLQTDLEWLRASL
jgi:hypothetical protein